MHTRRFLLLCALLATFVSGPVRAEEREIAGYLTQHQRRLPLLEYAPYQRARHVWLAGFIAAWSGAGVLTTGTLAMVVGTHSGQSDSVQHNSLVAGGSLLGIGVVTTALGATLWYLGRHELTSIEGHLPLKDGIVPPSALSLQVSF